MPLAACFQNEILRARSAVTSALIAALFLGGTFAQINGYRQWEGARRTDADVWDVRDAIPQTLAFLRTQPPLVVLGSDSELLDSVVLYAPVKVYWSTFASQYVVSDEEAAERARAVATWRPNQPYPLKYEADLHLAVGRECREPSTLLLVYSNAAEHTCLFRIPALFSGMR